MNHEPLSRESDNPGSKGVIVFLAVNSSYSHSSLAGWYLRNYALQAGWAWHEVETVQSEPLSGVLQRALRLKPDIVAASFYLFNHDFLSKFLPRLKALRPDSVVIGGGPEFLGDNRRFLEQHREVDVVVRGEGEIAFRKLLQCFREPEKWNKIKGLCFFHADRFYDNGRAEAVQTLDEIPSPFRNNPRTSRKPFVLMETTRGCSNNCAFCTSAGDRVRLLSLERIQSDLKLLAADGVREIRLADRTFNENPRRSLEIVRIMRTEYAGTRFHLEIDPARVSADLIGEFALARAGQFHLEAGIQTTNAAVINAIGRAGLIAEALAALETLCRMRNLAVHVDLLAGLPGSTLDELFADFAVIALMEPSEIQLEILKVLPGTRLSAQPGEIIRADNPPYEILKTGSMDYDDLVAARRLSRFIDWFYNAPALHSSVITAIRTLPSFCEQFLGGTDDFFMACNAPALEKRFRLLDQFARRGMPGLVPKLAYAWLKCGLSARHGLCPVAPWKKPLPAGALFIEGDINAIPGRIYLAELERHFLFVYGHSPRGGACAIYALA